MVSVIVSAREIDAEISDSHSRKAGNQIRYLPFELLALLGGNKQITIRPNPLIEVNNLLAPTTSDIETPQDEDHLGSAQLQDRSLSARLNAHLELGRSLRARHAEERRIAGDEVATDTREELIYLASSSVRYFDAVGMPWRRSDESYEIVFGHAASTASKSPSLFELVLRCAQREYNLAGLPIHIPAAVSTALNKAAKDVEVGNQRCTTCNREFIIPRAEWMEYWFSGPPTQAALTQDAILPFLRKACSWACAETTAVGGFK